jgi:sortase A
MSRILRCFSALILIVGFTLTAHAAYLHAKGWLAGKLIRRAWEQTIATGEVHRPWQWADTHPIARLTIPRLGYDEIVLEGATPRTLAFGPARLLDSVEVGQPGNLVLAGHRTSWFEPLKDIKNGDYMQIEWLDLRRRELHHRTYVVEAITITDPQHLGMLAPTDDDALTLITCYPFGRSPRSPQRFLVLAIPQSAVTSASF